MPDKTAAVWGPRIKGARLERDVTQVQLAAQLGVEQTVVSKWELGQSRISDDRKVQIAEALGVSLEELFPWSALAEQRAS